MMKRYLLSLLLLFAIPAVVQAQSVPNQAAAPIQQGVVWTPQQWIAAWQSKADASGGTLTNPTITGGTTSSTADAASVTATGATTSRTLADRANDTKNIKDYGAKCDGATDDTAAFTAAFTQADGTTILIPKDVTCIIDPSASGTTGVLRALNKAINIVGDNSKTSIIKLKTGSTIVNTSGVFFYQSSSNNLVLRDFTIDVNGDASTIAGVNSILGIQGAVNPAIRRVSIINATAGVNGGIYLIACNHCTSLTVDSSYLQFSSGSSTVQTKGITTLGSLGTNVGGTIANNVLVNTNTTFTKSIRFYIAGNDISGWGVGAGVATGQDDGSTQNTIVNNTVHDSLTAQDVFGVYPNGIENWSPYTLISNNKLFNNSGSGVANGGSNAFVIGNVAWDNSRGAAGVGSGISSASGGSSNAAGSIYLGNYAFDDGAGTQQYGYGDCCTSVGLVTLNQNNFSGTVGDMLLRGTNGHVIGPPQFSNFALLTSSSGNWTVPAAATLIEVTECAGGGAGGSVASGGGNAAAASGNPGQCATFKASVTPGASMAYTIGAGGTAAATGNNAGGNGGSTTFDGVAVNGGGGGNGSAAGNAAAFSLNTINNFPGTTPSSSVSIQSYLNNFNIGGSSSTGGNGVGCLWSARAVSVSNSAGTNSPGPYCGSGSGAGTTGTTAFSGGGGSPGAIAIRW